MRKTLSLLAIAVLVGAVGSGCANAERKLGRGLNNTMEIVRGGEFRRSMEQTALFSSPDNAYSTGMVRGFNRTIARTGIGIYEVVTSPFPPYGPACADKFPPGSVYPDNYTPTLMADSMFATDTYVGISGGDVLPIIPGNRFRIFDSP